jgi:endonuclease YncB( thermonuclease family)
MPGLLRHPDLRALALLCIGLPAYAANFEGTVTHVSDGDTVWVRPDRGGAPIAVRLVGIDAPESCQAFGAEAKRALAARVLHEHVTVRTRALDDYHRSLARIELAGEDVNAWMVRHGYAWSMTFKGRRGAYARVEAQARRAHAGLWSGRAPENPRSFRQRHGPCP